MISKISYIKLIREDIRHRGWLAALSGVLLFLSMPVYTLIYLDSYSEDPEVLKEFADTFSGFINGYNSAFLIILIGILAFAVGISGFQFMHKKEKLDFYHGLALKRHQLFAISYLAGLFLFLIPYIVCTVLTILVGAVKGIMTLSLAGECFLTMGTGILAFLLIYHTCIFAGMLTGRSVTMFLGTLVIGVYPSLVLTLLPSLRDAFFQTTYNVHDSIPEKLSEYLSPFPLFIRMLEQNNSYSNVFMITAALVLIVLLLAASIMLYRIYPSESAGNALAFKFTPPVFKVLISIPTAVFISLLVKSFIGASGTKWIIILSMLAIVLLCGLIEFIYWQDLKMLLKGWRSSVIAIGFVAVLLAVFQFDFTGYPEDYTSEDDRESFVLSDDVDVLYNLAQSGIENVKKGITPNTLYSSQTSMHGRIKIPTIIYAPHFALNWKAGRKFIETTVFPIMKRLRHSQSSAKKKITARNFSRSSMWRKKTYLLSRFRIFI